MHFTVYFNKNVNKNIFEKINVTVKVRGHIFLWIQSEEFCHISPTMFVCSSIKMKNKQAVGLIRG